ncbi:MAG: urease accessory protein UreD [Povalibacter sp.]
MNSVISHATGEQGWLAQLNLSFAEREGRTYLANRSHVGPLVVQRAFHPEGNTCHAYIVHPPGGIVGGDELRLDVDVQKGTQVLLTTPAATKFYRSAGRFASQYQTLTVQAAQLEWLPQETIFFAGSRARAETRIMLESGSRFIGWEIPCLGLPARNQPFEQGELELNLELWRDGTPLFIDRMRLSGDSPARNAAWGLAGHEAIGTMIAYPATREHADMARAIVCETISSVTLVDGVLVCRALGPQAGPVKDWLIEVWKQLRPMLLGRAPILPRIWAT